MSHRIWVLYIGSEGCPFCAAESWALYNSLRNYGSWSGVTQSYSNSTTKYPDTPGLSFYDASLSSSAVHFTGYETYSSNWKPLEKLNQTDQSLFQEYDPLEKIPFVLTDGIYMRVGSAIKLSLLHNFTTQEVLNDLSSKTATSHSSAILSESNNISGVLNLIKKHMENTFVISINKSFSAPTMMAEFRNVGFAQILSIISQILTVYFHVKT